MELILLVILAVPSYLPVTLIQKIYEHLLMKLCSPMSKISVLMLQILQIFCESYKMFLIRYLREHFSDTGCYITV